MRMELIDDRMVFGKFSWISYSRSLYIGLFLRICPLVQNKSDCKYDGLSFTSCRPKFRNMKENVMIRMRGWYWLIKECIFFSFPQLLRFASYKRKTLVDMMGPLWTLVIIFQKSFSSNAFFFFSFFSFFFILRQRNAPLFNWTWLHFRCINDPYYLSISSMWKGRMMNMHIISASLTGISLIRWNNVVGFFCVCVEWMVLKFFNFHLWLSWLIKRRPA